MKLPEPVDKVDYYYDELRRYVVNVTIEINGLAETQSNTDICVNAVEGFRHKTLDGNAEIAHSDLVKNVKIDMKTHKVFDLKAWETKTMKKCGFKLNGNPIRPSDKERPTTETTLGQFVNKEGDK